MSVRFERDSPTIKHTGLFGPLRARRIAQLQGFDDALFVDSASLISEGPTWNIAVCISGQIIWPKAECLSGVTMRLVQSHISRFGPPSSTAPLQASEIPAIDFAFTTNAVTGVRPISTIDDHAMPIDVKMIRQLGEAYWGDPGESI